MYMCWRFYYCIFVLVKIPEWFLLSGFIKCNIIFLGCKFQHLGHNRRWSIKKHRATSFWNIHPYFEEDEPWLGRAGQPAGPGRQTWFYIFIRELCFCVSWSTRKPAREGNKVKVIDFVWRDELVYSPQWHFDRQRRKNKQTLMSCGVAPGDVKRLWHTWSAGVENAIRLHGRSQQHRHYRKDRSLRESLDQTNRTGTVVRNELLCYSTKI